MYPGITAIDGNRIRFSFSDWRGMVAIKALRSRIRELVNRSYRNPEKGLTEGHKMWLGIWEEVMKVVGERV
jgi:ATP-dependent RNA helicase DHX29